MSQPTRRRPRPLVQHTCARSRGFTLLEVVTVTAILSVLATLAYATLRTVPGSARVSSGVMELVGEFSSAKSQAYGRDVRVGVLLHAPASGAIRYWTVLDPWLTLDDAMQASPGWTRPEDLVPPAPPATPGASYQVVGQGTLDRGVMLVAGGYREVVGDMVDSRCLALGLGTFVLASGTGGGGGYFPPPYCMVPDDSGCTFCNTAGGATRGALLFESDGRIRLLAGNGMETTAGAGSIALSAPDLPASKSVAVALTGSGLIHTFRGPNR